MTIYKPLTPKLRKDINESIDKRIAELNTCEQNALVKNQINAMTIFRRWINVLRDGTPIPFEK